MGQRSCFVCCKEFIPKNVNGKKSKSNQELTGSSNGNLQVIFLLRKLLEIPEDTCCKLLQHFGNPNSWIECCSYCLVLVEKCQKTFDQIRSLEKHYDELRMDIKNAIFKSQKTFDYDYKCEAIVRSHIITRDIDYFIKTEVTEKGKNICRLSNTENEVETISGLESQFDSQYSLTSNEDYQSVVTNTNDSFVSTSEKLFPVVHDNAEKDTGDYNFTPTSNSEETRVLLEVGGMVTVEERYHQEIDEQAIDIKPLPLFIEQETGDCTKSFKVDDKASERFSNRSHHEEQAGSGKPYECPICGKRVASSRNLNRHIKTHTNEKPFKCNICGLTFSNKYTLKRHSLMHGDAKPYKCDHCGQSFRRRDTLTIHETTHTVDGGLPFHCDMCGKSFTSKQSLKVHYRRHAQQKSFKCKTCGKSFTMLHSFKIHSRIHSNMKPPE